MANLLTALSNIVQNPNNNLAELHEGNNRANSMGDALEKYIQKIFCGERLPEEIFSYLGNQNNPPDMILKNGDAIEVKKIENFSSALALNSSYPKDKLYFSDTRITTTCKNCEQTPWHEKDIIYTVGVSQKNTQKLQTLCFVYGDCYSASPEIYTRIAEKIKKGVQEIPDIEFVKTNELAKIKKVDPLGITDLRMRGMWHIQNPFTVFQSFFSASKETKFSVFALMKTEKFLSFPEKDQKNIENLQNENFQIQNILIPNPNNPAKMMEGKVFVFLK